MKIYSTAILLIPLQRETQSIKEFCWGIFNCQFSIFKNTWSFRRAPNRMKAWNLF